MKKLLPLLLLSLAFSGKSQDTPADAAALRTELLEAYGYCGGQKFSLERIKAEFPALRAQAVEAESEFESAFGPSCRAVADSFGPDARKEFDTELKKQRAATVISEAMAANYIREVELRARGIMESPWRETIIAFHPAFVKDPVLEFSRGFKHKFTTADFPQAKGLDVEIWTPISWKFREARAPNILLQYRSKNGRGDASFLVQIRDVAAPNRPKPTQRDIDAMFSPAGLRAMVGSAVKVLEMKAVALEGEKGGVWVYEAAAQRLGNSVTMRILQYAVYYDNRLIVLQFACGGPEAKRAEWVVEFEKHLPLFHQVANSLTIVEKHK